MTRRCSQDRPSAVMRVLVAGAGLAGLAAAYNAMPFHGSTVSDCTVTDGDTLRCGDERIRINGIDTPEMAGHCRPGRACVPGDPIAARDSLEAWLGTSPVTIDRLKQDRYGRTIATLTNDNGDAACWQLERGIAIYIVRWDESRVTRKTCGL